MFNIDYNIDKNTVYISGKFDGSMEKKALEVFGKIDSSLIVDMTDLDYISSAGIGVLVKTYTRLKNANEKILLTNLNDHIREVFKISKLDTIFEIK